MTTPEVKALLKKNNLKWSDFVRWMNGQTVGGTSDNPDWYEYDVRRFIRNSSSK